MTNAKTVDLAAYQPQSAGQIGSSVEKNMTSYEASFRIAFASALGIYQKHQDEIQKTDLQHVYICFLRSSITQNLPLFRIDLYNEKETADMEECSADWDVAFSKQIFVRLPKVRELLPADKKNNLLVEKFWFQETEVFFQAIKAYLPSIIETCRRHVPADVQWHYGEYFDQCELIL